MNHTMETLKILVTDDSEASRSIIVNTLKKAGFHHVDEAVDGRDALARLYAGHYHLLITDWNMPGMDGIELVRNVRSESKLQKTMILMVTSRCKRDDILNAVRSGIDGYIAKPFSPQTIMEKIADILKNRGDAA